MSRALIWKRLVLPLLVVFAVSAAVFAVLYGRAGPARRAELEVEAGKAMLQVIAAVLVGSIVTAIIKDFEESKRAWLAKRELLRADLTNGLLTLYSRAKSARRRLRAGVRIDHAGVETIETKKYDELLQEISDIQLGLERYKRQAAGGEKGGLLPKPVFLALEAMEKYLNGLVSEYEEVLKSADGNIGLVNLPKLRDFIGRYSTSRFRSDFVGAYDTAAQMVAEALEKDLLRVKRTTVQADRPPSGRLQR